MTSWMCIRARWVGVGRGATAIVGDRDVPVFRIVCDPDAAVDRLRRNGLVANRVVDGPEVLLAFLSGQRGIAQALAEIGVAAKPVGPPGLVTVVSCEGGVTRQLVDAESVNATVRALHSHVYGEFGAFAVGHPVLPAATFSWERRPKPLAASTYRRTAAS